MKEKSLYIISIIALAAAFCAAVVLSVFLCNSAPDSSDIPAAQTMSNESAEDDPAESPAFVAADYDPANYRLISDTLDSVIIDPDADSGNKEEEPYDGWFKEGKFWYYRDQDGKLLYGWQLIDDEWYYLEPDTGRMALDCWVRDDAGIPCYLKEDGIMVYGGLSWIGDSLSANWYPAHAIDECFYHPHVVAKALKCIYEDHKDNPSGLTAAKGMVLAGSMENTLVFEMGSNNDWHTPDLTFTDKINMLLDIVGKKTKIILVTCYTVDDKTTEEYFGDINREMHELSEKYNNIALADWAAICDPATDLKLTDGLHHKTPESAYKYIKLIQDTLIENFGPFYYLAD